MTKAGFALSEGKSTLYLAAAEETFLCAVPHKEDGIFGGKASRRRGCSAPGSGDLPLAAAYPVTQTAA
jgi:hypothetical protein